MRSVEIFAGAGGLALGNDLAGFKTAAIVEWDRWACDTVRQNKLRGYPPVADWQIIEGDVRKVRWEDAIDGQIDLVSGGPPCQPFSMGGRARSADDQRDMFPTAADAIGQLRPRAFILENVRGLTRASFSSYFQYIQLRLGNPEVISRPNESWIDHYGRLQVQHSSGATGLRYNVFPHVVNAADFGVPQQRHRVFLVGFRSDIGSGWTFPEATHSRTSLQYDQFVSGSYWDRNRVSRSRRLPSPSDAVLATIKRDHESSQNFLPWRTVRDAIGDMPRPSSRGSSTFLNHKLQLGARSYPGHTGSHIDLPAKTLKAGGHGVPGGENMIRYQDGSLRYFTVRESARLQTFPDNYELHGSWTEVMRQLGNAVPVHLAQVVASSVRDHLAACDSTFSVGVGDPVDSQLIEV